MVLGTMSSAGKSLITAGLCRIFMQDGYRVAPFKAQNMSLNSFVTRDGLEMGRAQVMQAEACKIEPDVRMNPILLKPNSETGSQVILNGRVMGNMTATQYYKNKSSFIPEIRKAYQSLADEYDIIVLEGAGSPAEINLKSVDIVNMGMAEISDSPVILVGDIDRGGVFASLYGTIALMDEDEKKRFKGLIINKFRGNPDILQSGLDMIEELTNVQVLGVVPYMKNLGIDDEDSLSDKLTNKKVSGIIDIAVIKLEHISNFTDFNAVDMFDNVSVRMVETAKELGTPDLIIIPGTKSTISDLQKIRKNGLEAEIIKAHEKDIPILGICGGFQILGKKISDPMKVENPHNITIDGMGLLDIETIFSVTKNLNRMNGKIAIIGGIFESLSGMDISGYEIHMGETKVTGENINPFTMREDYVINGLANAECNVFGTYVHGFFDRNMVAVQLVKALKMKKGIIRQEDEEQDIDWEKHKQSEYDRIADCLRRSLDIEKIYEIIFPEKTI